MTHTAVTSETYRGYRIEVVRSAPGMWQVMVYLRRPGLPQPNAQDERRYRSPEAARDAGRTRIDRWLPAYELTEK